MRILEAAFIKSVTDISQTRALLAPEVCFIGRSNVGKSSLINRLTSRKIARTGSTPGATRLINLYDVRYEREGTQRNCIFSDFPGFGYAKVGRTIYAGWQKMIESYMTTNRRIKYIVWAFDLRRDFDELDRMLSEWLLESDLPFSLVLTKADKEGRGRQAQRKLFFQKLLPDKAVFLFSAQDGTGKRELTAHVLAQM